MNNEEKIAKRIISYMGKEPELSTDISTRLEFARNLALKKIKPSYKQEKNKFDFTFGLFKHKMVWTVGAIATMLVIVLIPMSQFTQESKLNEEISYHVDADTLPVDFINNEL